MVKRPDLKVVVMSATMDAVKFQNYFAGAPMLKVCQIEVSESCVVIMSDGLHRCREGHTPLRSFIHPSRSVTMSRQLCAQPSIYTW